MEGYFSHSAYNRWYRQYAITLGQITTQFDALRLSVETIPFSEEVRHLLESEIDEIDTEREKILPRSFMLGANPLETRETFVENLKVMANVILRLLQTRYRFESIYAQEKKRVLKNYQGSNIKGRLSNLRRHMDEAIREQMKALAVASSVQTKKQQTET